jgi:hypothetical protein
MVDLIIREAKCGICIGYSIETGFKDFVFNKQEIQDYTKTSNLEQIISKVDYNYLLELISNKIFTGVAIITKK